MISDFQCEAEENCTLLSYYTVHSGNSSPTLRDKLLVPSLSVNLKMGLTGCPSILVRNYHYTLHNHPEQCSSHQNIP